MHQKNKKNKTKQSNNNNNNNKTETGTKIVTPSIQSTRLPILLAQIKA